MPVRRYENLAEAERDLWIDAKDPSLGERIRRVWSFAERFGVRAPRGVRRTEIDASRLERTTFSAPDNSVSRS